MGDNVLITGASGLVGKALSEYLILHGYNVAHLGRKREFGTSVTSFIWDYKNKFIEPEAVTFPDYVVHLAGAGLFEKQWTKEYKNEIISSRADSAKFLLKELLNKNRQLKGFVSASGISIYGDDTKDKLVDETSLPGTGFLAEVVKSWEGAANEYAQASIRTVILRIGIVLSNKGGALEKMLLPVRMGIGSPLGSGDQYISWVHIKDLCKLFCFAIENQMMEGVFNATSPNPCNNRNFMKTAAIVLKKPLWLPAVPSLLLKVILGREKAALAIGGNKVSCRKVEKAGFTFEYPTLQGALQNLYF